METKFPNFYSEAQKALVEPIEAQKNVARETFLEISSEFTDVFEKILVAITPAMQTFQLSPALTGRAGIVRVAPAVYNIVGGFAVQKLLDIFPTPVDFDARSPDIDIQLGILHEYDTLGNWVGGLSLFDEGGRLRMEYYTFFTQLVNILASSLEASRPEIAEVEQELEYFVPDAMDAGKAPLIYEKRVGLSASDEEQSCYYAIQVFARAAPLQLQAGGRPKPVQPSVYCNLVVTLQYKGVKEHVLEMNLPQMFYSILDMPTILQGCLYADPLRLFEMQVDSLIGRYTMLRRVEETLAQGGSYRREQLEDRIRQLSTKITLHAERIMYLMSMLEDVLAQRPLNTLRIQAALQMLFFTVDEGQKRYGLLRRSNPELALRVFQEWRAVEPSNFEKRLTLLYGGEANRAKIDAILAAISIQEEEGAAAEQQKAEPQGLHAVPEAEENYGEDDVSAPAPAAAAVVAQQKAEPQGLQPVPEAEESYGEDDVSTYAPAAAAEAAGVLRTDAGSPSSMFMDTLDIEPSGPQQAAPTAEPEQKTLAEVVSVVGKKTKEEKAREREEKARQRAEVEEKRRAEKEAQRAAAAAKLAEQRAAAAAAEEKRAKEEEKRRVAQQAQADAQRLAAIKRKKEDQAKKYQAEAQEEALLEEAARLAAEEKEKKLAEATRKVEEKAEETKGKATTVPVTMDEFPESYIDTDVTVQSHFIEEPYGYAAKYYQRGMKGGAWTGFSSKTMDSLIALIHTNIVKDKKENFIFVPLLPHPTNRYPIQEFDTTSDRHYDEQKVTLFESDLQYFTHRFIGILFQFIDLYYAFLDAKTPEAYTASKRTLISLLNVFSNLGIKVLGSQRFDQESKVQLYKILAFVKTPEEIEKLTKFDVVTRLELKTRSENLRSLLVMWMPKADIELLKNELIPVTIVLTSVLMVFSHQMYHWTDSEFRDFPTDVYNASPFSTEKSSASSNPAIDNYVLSPNFVTRMITYFATNAMPPSGHAEQFTPEKREKAITASYTNIMIIAQFYRALSLSKAVYGKATRLSLETKLKNYKVFFFFPFKSLTSNKTSGEYKQDDVLHSRFLRFLKSMGIEDSAIDVPTTSLTQYEHAEPGPAEGEGEGVGEGNAPLTRISYSNPQLVEVVRSYLESLDASQEPMKSGKRIVLDANLRDLSSFFNEEIDKTTDKEILTDILKYISNIIKTWKSTVKEGPQLKSYDFPRVFSEVITSIIDTSMDDEFQHAGIKNIKAVKDEKMKELHKLFTALIMSVEPSFKSEVKRSERDQLQTVVQAMFASDSFDTILPSFINTICLYTSVFRKKIIIRLIFMILKLAPDSNPYVSLTGSIQLDNLNEKDEYALSKEIFIRLQKLYEGEHAPRIFEDARKWAPHVFDILVKQKPGILFNDEFNERPDLFPFVKLSEGITSIFAFIYYKIKDLLDTIDSKDLRKKIFVECFMGPSGLLAKGKHFISVADNLDSFGYIQTVNIKEEDDMRFYDPVVYFSFDSLAKLAQEVRKELEGPQKSTGKKKKGGARKTLRSSKGRSTNLSTRRRLRTKN